MAEKKTKRVFFGELRVLAEGNDELVAFIDKEIQLLDKKANGKKAQEVNKEQSALMETIKAELTRVDRKVTVTELQKESELLTEYSNQKLSAMLKKLTDSGEVKKIIEGKKSFFIMPE